MQRGLAPVQRFHGVMPAWPGISKIQAVSKACLKQYHHHVAGRFEVALIARVSRHIVRQQRSIIPCERGSFGARQVR